jgi:hypothetical protein
MARPAISATGRRRLTETADRLRALLPGDWKVAGAAKTAETGELTVWAPDGTNASIYVIATDRLEPRDLHRWRLPVSGPTLVAAPWISPRTRELLRDYGAGYLDATGNAELRLAEPALFVRTTGDDRDPNPKPRQGPSLNGPRAWALLRTLIEVTPPYNAGDLAATLSLDDGYVSRALKVLGDERLIERRPRGPVTAVEWEPLLRRLIQTYSLLDANTTSTWIAAAGPDRLVDDLSSLRVGRWAVTGSFVASRISPVAAPEIAVVYTEDAERLAKAARLLPAKTGANVVLADPYDPIVFERGQDTDGVRSVSIAQAAIDCLTGPGRMPAEGDALLAWMRRYEPRWRAPGLTA